MIDLIIIGGGPAGYVAAERAGKKGLNVVLFEKKSLGGVCLNEGCIPTKTLLYSAKTYESALNGSKYGIIAENVSFEYAKLISRKNKIVRKLVAGVKAKMKMNNVTVVEGEATITGRSSEGVEVTSGGEVYKGANLLVCTGSEAAVPPIPGLAEAGDVIVTNREILDMKEQPKSLVVIGGGVIGMEFASFFNSLGTKVTVIEMLPEILGNNDFEISAMLRKTYARKGIEFNLNAKVVQIDGNKVVYEKDGESHSVEGEKILVSVGRRAVTQGLGLESIGVELTRGRFDVCADDHCQRYQGITKQSTELVKKVIEATRGEVAMHADVICDARFSKCCGGVMETFENVWEPIVHPYLQAKADNLPENSVPDLTDEQCAEDWIRSVPPAFCNTNDANVLKQVLNDYDQETPDFYRWKVTYHQEELSSLIKARSGIDYGDIIALEPVERGTSGRIKRLRIIGTERVKTIGKELEIRRTLSPSHLYSSAFVVDAEGEEEGVPRQFTLTGAGWGHGVGLCQIGAAMMAEKKYAYMDILTHYYPGIDINKYYL